MKKGRLVSSIGFLRVGARVGVSDGGALPVPLSARTVAAVSVGEKGLVSSQAWWIRGMATFSSTVGSNLLLAVFCLGGLLSLVGNGDV